MTAIKFGDQKDDGSWSAPLSDSARATLQEMVDWTGERFVGHVAARRGLSREAVLGTKAAVIPHSDAALAGGFIDAIASEEEAFAALAALVRGETPDAGPVAGAGTPADPAATSSATEQEADMAVKTKMAAILAGKDDAETKLKALAKLAESAEPEEEAADGEDDDEDEMAKDKAAEDDEPEEEAAEGEDEEPKAAATGAMAAVALATSPQAKGREALARKLAAKVQAKKLTYGEAKDMLAAAPKSGRLAEAMGGRTPALGGGGGAPAGGEKAAEASWDKAFAKVPGAKPR
ncbi:S49 family peptidase [Methylobrevis pamukkalensis]|uniref:Peptidase family S49 n=1 Tax=Methylobrevis pamukkalensis TaxID=1439726 RepID=A0A1E3H1N5_9HYPH|nr:S49 family peptidase [Methylobrevis pamukkalensis]ODN70212.1 Peptidase family S49 [Methylobrevis pamukkalensis]